MKKKYCAFTIVAKNYIGLAKVLQTSINDHNEDVDFYIFIADELSSKNDIVVPDNVLESRKILSYTDEEWVNMAFKYNLTEFCTAIKPYCFKYLFYEKEYDEVIYFDPDIFVFSSLSPIFDRLQTCSIMVTPHIVFPKLEDNTDRSYLQAGPYNLGFLGLRKTESSRLLLDWWGKRLKINCFDEVLDYTFTDQKWILMIHSFFPQEEIDVCRNLGMNVAPWNFCERKIVKKGDKFFVENRDDNTLSNEIVFVHYSGYDYKALLEGKEIRPRVSKVNVEFEDVSILMGVYVDALTKNETIMREYLSMPYTYATYEDGIIIERFHRRLYHRLSDVDNSRFINPFMTGEGSFHELLKNKGFLHKNIVRTVSESKIGGSVKSLIIFNKTMKIVSKLLGYQRYLMLLRLMKHFSRYASQIFLLDNKYIKNNIYLPVKHIL